MYYQFHKQWVPEITHHCPKTPFILAGAELESRDDPAVLEKLSRVQQSPITTEIGRRLAAELRAVAYVEFSCLTKKGLKNVFDEAILTALEPPDPKLGFWARMGKAKFCCAVA